MKNRLMTAALAVALSAAMVVPASASSIVSVNKNQNVTGSGGNQLVNSGNHSAADNGQPGTTATSNGKYFNFPGWLWIGENCYYIETVGQKNVGTGWFETGRILKNTITPDGYTVDAEGRWVVNGVVQTNDYGNVKMGMGAQYVDKSKDEVWVLMKNALKDVWSKMYTINGWKAYSEPTSTFIQGQVNPNYNGQSYFYGSNETDAIRIRIPGYWHNQALGDGIDRDIISINGTISSDIEKTIKIALGDNAGQEFFNYLRTFADNNFSESSDIVYDESGNMILDTILHKKDGTAWEVDENKNIIRARPELNGGNNSREYYTSIPKSQVTVTGMGNGIEKIDLSLWQNRTTDYGKRFSITNDGYITIYF